jgi:hypothetical protein
MVIAIIAVPLVAAVAVTIWTVPRPGTERPLRERQVARRIMPDSDAAAPHDTEPRESAREQS